MKPVFSLLICCCLLMLSPTSQAACKLGQSKDFLYLHVPASAQPMLEFYYTSLCQSEQVELSQITVEENASIEAQALYYFGLNNLQRYEGIATPNMPDLVEMGQQANIDWIIGEAQLNKAISYIDKDQILAGEKLLHQVIPIARKVGYSRLLARAYRWLGNIKSQQSEIKASLNYYKMAYQIVVEIEDDFQTTMTLNNIATIYMMLEEWQRAEDYIHRALDLYQNNTYANSLFEAVLYGNSSAIYFANQQYQLAEHYMQLSLKEAEQTGSISLRVVTLADMARHNAKANNSDKALEIAQRCVDLATQESQSRVMVAICEEAVALAHLSKKDYPKVIHYANKVLDAISDSEIEELVWEADILATLVEAYEAIGEYQLALEQLKRQTIIQQAYYDQAHSAEILNERNSLERTLNQREVELLEATNELQEIRLQGQRWRDVFIASIIIIIGYFVVRAIIRLKRNNRDLLTQNTTDALTGLRNRRYLDQWLAQLASLAHHNQHLLLCVIDIDHFKQFNDQHGHEVGDEVLRHTARVLQASIRSQDLLVRWGGEEFIAIIPLDQKQLASATLERLRGKVEQHQVQYHNQSFSVTISLGACCCSTSSLSHRWEAVFSRADSALYQAKQAGRNRYQLIDDPNLATPSRIDP